MIMNGSRVARKKKQKQNRLISISMSYNLVTELLLGVHVIVVLSVQSFRNRDVTSSNMRMTVTAIYVHKNRYVPTIVS